MISELADKSATKECKWDMATLQEGKETESCARIFPVYSGFLKYLLNSSRSCSRARESRVFTAVALKFRISEVSLSEYSSRSRRTNTIFSAGVRRWRVLMRISRSSVARYCASGFGAQSATSNGSLVPSLSEKALLSIDCSRIPRRFRIFINDSLRAMRTSQVENFACPWNWSNF
jgi:hypothetical protein